ncbi:MAG TPA: biotin carboxylase [Lachnospiraceae bacterium]|nr:biotin carboxylase [Lachnospiraceae bacterium]
MNISELKKHKFIVIGYEHYNPLGVIRSLGENGIRPIVIMLKDDVKIASMSKYVGKLYFVKNNDQAYQLLLKKYGREEYKPFVIPCDDNITELLDKKYDKLKNRFYVANAGAAGRITHYMNKFTLCDLAERHGLNVAKSWVVKKGEIPSDLIYPLITKPLTSYPDWKLDYRVCNNEEELRKAYSEIKGEDLMLQQYITKVNELCLDGFVVDHGRKMLAAIASTYTYILPDYFSMEMVVKNFDNEALKKTLQAMFAEVGFEGIFSTEFMIDKDGKLWFLEINFRNSTWSYAATKLGMNLPLLWAEGMITGDIRKDAEKAIPENYIALAEVDDFIQRVVKHKMIGVGKWIKGLKRADCLFYWNKDDKRPTIVYWINRVTRVIKKKLHLYKAQEH